MITQNKNKFALIHRILHWTIAVLMGILFATGFLRMTWMSKKSIIDIVSSQIQNQNIFIEKQQIIPIVKGIQSPMWKWHEYAAYIMFIAFICRIIYMVVKGIKFPKPFTRNQPLNERLQGITYIVFYLFVAISIVTGAYLQWGNGTYKEPMEAIHKWAIYWFPLFIVMHFGGIVLGELSKKKGITSKMIGGN
ncbi:cytochrome b/b6 domain-containing protein [Sphingobacterium cavernae]|uniref:cytochrome b/b6 domain-containing protein n=1 Tax=Sphingobacterium cavernae TaxID=2592657 RepID=UPI00122FCC07|nr:cytochrome b/b6 domain-containing protein [Sphingobacterium cavernae]